MLNLMMCRSLSKAVDHRTPRMSSDQGESWGGEIHLRDDAGDWDLGYPATVQREDGRLVTVYYFNDAPEEPRYIAATIWDPGP